MTIKECQEEHKKLWNWIADETEAIGKPASKDAYFRFIGMNADNISELPRCSCFACEYDRIVRNDNPFETCKNCPIDWGKIVETCDLITLEHTHTFCEYLHLSPYRKWYELSERDDELNDEEIREYIHLAREVANLPFKEV